MKKILLIVLVLSLSLSFIPTSFAATQVDALIRKLVEKDILTKEEARELKAEIVQDEKLAREEGMKQSLPSWVQDMKIKGDFRMRYQHENRKSTNARDRARVRARLGVETNVNEKTKVAVGLTTGNGDPRSGNQTLDNNFEKPQVRFDYAYAQYNPGEWLSLNVGKIMKPYWNPGDLIFDTDITFDGFGANWSHALNSTNKLLFNMSFAVLEENSTENYEPYLYGFQPGIETTLTPTMKLRTMGGYYAVDTIKNYSRFAQNTPSVGNSVSGGRYIYDYDMLTASTEFSVDNPFGFEEIPTFVLFGEFVRNPNGGDHDQGFQAGASLGDKKVSGPGQWKIGYNYRRLERDAVLEVFPDSDFYGGGTHVQGHEATLSYGIAKNVSVDFDYYRVAPIGGEETDGQVAKVEHLWQTDLNFKF